MVASTGVERRFRLRDSRPLAFAVALSAGSPVLGQTVVARPATAQSGNKTASDLPQSEADIVVTARKRAETTQDIPVAEVAYTSQTIQRQNLTSLEKVAAITPSFSIGRATTGSGAQLTIRGIGSNSSSIGIEQSVAVVVDNVYYGQGRVINEGLLDLQRIEILKGPQALFFGKNATAGVVSITTADPGPDPEVKLSTNYEFGSKNLQGTAIVSEPIAGNLGIRIAVRASKMFGGYFENHATEQTYVTHDVARNNFATTHFAPPGPRESPGGHDLLGRVTLKWAPLAGLTATLKASGTISDVNNAGWNAVLFRCPVGGVSQLNPAVHCGRHFVIYNNEAPPDIGAVQPFGRGNGNLGDQYHSWSVTGTVNYDLPGVSLSSVTNYNRNRNDWEIDGDFTSSSLPVNAIATELSTFRSFSSEARALTTFHAPINFLFGAYYQNTTRVYHSANANGGFENSAAPDPSERYLGNIKYSQTRGETLAAFGQLIWKPISNLEVAAGGRLTHETKNSFFVEPYVNPKPAAAGTFLPNVLILANQRWNNFSPEATVTYKPVTNITIYGAYKTGYKSGGFSNSGILNRFNSVNDFAFAPERVKGVEGGIKTRLFDRQLTFNVDAYRYLYSDLQIDFFNAGTFAFTTFNAGTAVAKGVESEFQYRPHNIPGLSLQGTVNYDDTHYVQFKNAPCYTGETPAEGCTIIGGRPTQDLSGVRTSIAPKWTASLGAGYETPISKGWIFGASVQGRYSGSYLASPFGAPLSRQPSYTTIDGSVRVRSEDDRWEVALIGKNLTNRFYVTGYFEATATGRGTATAAGVPSDQLGFAALPRTVELQVTAHF